MSQDSNSANPQKRKECQTLGFLHNIRFHIDASLHKSHRELCEQLKANGGIIAKRHYAHVHVHVVPDGVAKVGGRAVDVSIVEDWVAKRCLGKGMPLVLRVLKRDTAPSPAPFSCDTAPPPAYDGRSGSRKSYTQAEELAIAAFLETAVDKELPSNSGTSVPMSVWRKMERQLTTSHSAVSMKKHYAARLAPRMSMYRRLLREPAEANSNISAAALQAPVDTAPADEARPCKARRTSGRWTDDETAQLANAYRELGPQWSTIHASYFQNSKRSQIDLKDKYRNLVKQGKV